MQAVKLTRSCMRPEGTFTFGCGIDPQPTATRRTLTRSAGRPGRPRCDASRDCPPEAPSQLETHVTSKTSQEKRAVAQPASRGLDARRLTSPAPPASVEELSKAIEEDGGAVATCRPTRRKLATPRLAPRRPR